MANSNSVFTAPKAAAAGNATTETIFKKSSNSSANAAVVLPGSSKFDGKVFRVCASGYFNGGTTGNLTIALYSGTSTAVAGNTKIATTSATAVNVTNGTWQLVFEGVTDGTGKRLMGTQYGFINATALTPAIQTGVATVDPATEGNQFCISALFSASSTTNECKLMDFHIEQA